MTVFTNTASSPSSTSTHHLLRSWQVLAFVILVLTVLKGIRAPNIWSYSHFLFDYQLGFVKRGLVGSVFSSFQEPWLLSYEFFYFFSMLILFINVALLFNLGRALILTGDLRWIGCSLLFCSSLGVVFLAHSVGYFDQIGLLITLITLKISGFYRKLFFASLTLPIAMLAHEAILILFFPTIFMSLFLAIAPGKRLQQWVLLGLFSLALLCLAMMLTKSNLSPHQAMNLYHDSQNQVGINLRRDAFRVLHRTGEDNLQIMQNIWQKRWQKQEVVSSFLPTAPFILFLLVYLFKACRQAQLKAPIIMLTLLAASSPLVMHVFAWDEHRWNTLTLITAFMMMFVAIPKQTRVQQAPGYIPALFVLMIVWSAMANVPLFDGYRVQWFPFTDHWVYLENVMFGQASFPQIPGR